MEFEPGSPLWIMAAAAGGGILRQLVIWLWQDVRPKAVRLLAGDNRSSSRRA